MCAQVFPFAIVHACMGGFVCEIVCMRVRQVCMCVLIYVCVRASVFMYKCNCPRVCV